METAIDASGLDLVREHFVLPLLTKEQYTSTGDSENPSDLQRAMGIVDDLVASSFEDENDHPLCISRLNEVFRKQIWNALSGCGVLDLNKMDAPTRSQVLENILGAVFYATENWELAHVITPFLKITDGLGVENRISFYIRRKVGSDLGRI